MRLLRVFNRQKSRAISATLLHGVGTHLLEDLRDCAEYELGVHVIGMAEMSELNETFLGHTGSTDVITFNHGEASADGKMHGEIFICMDDAVTQARQFRTTWESEVVRYLAHGILHLEGYDDTEPKSRRAMKKEENKLVKELSRCFDLGKLGGVKNAGKGK
jgi:rRNA maturation RNase YbeY